MVLSFSDDDVSGTAFAARAATDFIHPASLSEWKALIAGAAAVVTPDSGASHVAGMLGVPAVVLFPPGKAPAHAAARGRRWATPARAVISDRGGNVASLVANEVEGLLA